MVNFICNAGQCNAGQCTVLNLIKKFSTMDIAASGAMCIHIAHFPLFIFQVSCHTASDFPLPFPSKRMRKTNSDQDKRQTSGKSHVHYLSTKSVH